MAGRIVADSRERLPEILSACDGQELLVYDDPNGSEAPFSYDLRVELAAGGTVKVERKALRSDAVQSWLDGKLPRQLSAVDLFCVELPDLFELAAEPYTQVEQNFLKHLEFVKLSVAVWETGGPADTMQRLRWLAERKDGLAIRPNRIEGQGSRENARLGIIRAVMAGTGHSPDRETPSGTIGQQLEAGTEWAAVAAALGIEHWDSSLDWGGRKPSRKTIDAMRDRVVYGPTSERPRPSS